MSLEDERALAHKAASQHGLFTATDAEVCGVPLALVRRRARAGQLVERQPLVFSAASSPFGIAAREGAALLSAGPQAMLSHLSAAARWQFRQKSPERPWITVPYGRTVPELWDVEVVRSRHLAGVHRLRDGVPLTCPARTLVDLGRVLGRDDVESALAIGLQKRRATVEEIERYLVLAHHTAGTGLVRDVLHRFRPEWESVLSARFGRLAEDAGLDLEPAWTLRDTRDGSVLAVLDFACPKLRLAIEVDGWAFHGSKAQQQADRQRDRRLLGLGWRTVRYTTEDVMLRSRQIVSELSALLRAAA